jgi:hypothetical protein
MERVIDQITAHPLFLKLKDVVEDNPWHDHESALDHSLETYQIAKREISAKFIINPKAKKSFKKFVNTKIGGTSRGEVMVLIALVHDIGKILYTKEDGDKKSILVRLADGMTTAPDHEYWSSTIVGELLTDCGFTDKKVIEYIKKVIRLHNTFHDNYIMSFKDRPFSELINDLKSRAENVYIEALFNIYCDNFTAKVAQSAQGIRIRIFNEPSLYTERKYFIP